MIGCCYVTSKGPFVVESLTETNAVIRVKGDKSSEPWNVSRQRLSKCSDFASRHGTMVRTVWETLETSCVNEEEVS